MRAWARAPTTLVDLFVLATMLAPLWLANLGFLRVLRIWTLSKSDLIWAPLRRRGYRDWEDPARAVVNLVTFLFVVTGFVYTFFRGHEGIASYVDALYFTVAAVTTTGFGDVTLPGTAGKLTSIVAMIVGISLFVRLAQAIFRPHKVTYRCPKCALMRHEPDAVCCKACGEVLKIPDEDED
jgi:voltage-gated potassium channel